MCRATFKIALARIPGRSMNTQTTATVSLAEFLTALSFVSDTGMGQSMEHGVKSAYIGLMLAEAAGLSAEDQVAAYYGALLKDAGCTACGTVFATFFDGDDIGPRSDSLLLRADKPTDAVRWFWHHASTDPALPVRMARLFSFMTQCRGVMKEGVIAHCEVGEMFAARLKLPVAVQRAIRFSWERWDGKGMGYGVKGEGAPVAARVLHLAQIAAAAHAFGGQSAARAIVAERKGSEFDPDLAGAFLHLTDQPDFWSMLDADSAQDRVLEMRPECSFDRLDGDGLETACALLADFADVKSRSTWNHSLQVAETTTGIATRLGLPAAEVSRLRRAALVHDLGKAAVPVGILDKTEPLTVDEWERFRLHPYYTERALTRVGPLRDLASDAGSHHETLDGSGYHRQLSRDQISPGGRIIAVADRFCLLSAAQSAPDPDRVMATIHKLAGSELDADACAALDSTAGQKPAVRPRTPGNLTEREVEVLRLVSEGQSNRQIATALVVSPKTIEHHVEHIFNKLGVASRTAAGVFAVQNGLAP